MQPVERHNHKGHGYHEDAEELAKIVDLQVKFANLVVRLLAVHTSARLFASVDHHGDRMTSRGKHSVGPERVLKGEGLFGLVIILVNARAEEALEVVNEVVGRICHHIPVIVLAQRRRILLSHSYGLAQLPVRLSVKLVRPDEDTSILVGRVEKQAVSREALILEHFDDVTDVKLCRSLHAPLSISFKVLVLLVVHDLVLLVAADIVDSLLDHAHHDDKDQGRYVSERVAHLESRDELRDADDQEEQVVEEFELIEQHDGDERDDVVAIVLKLVRHEATWGRLAGQRDPASLSRDNPATPATTPVAGRPLVAFFLL